SISTVWPSVAQSDLEPMITPTRAVMPLPRAAGACAGSVNSPPRAPAPSRRGPVRRPAGTGGGNRAGIIAPAWRPSTPLAVAAGLRSADAGQDLAAAGGAWGREGGCSAVADARPLVIPAHAGIQRRGTTRWIPAF